MNNLIAKAILFDMDGTLIDSRDQVELSWTKWCLLRGISPDLVIPICHGVRSDEVLSMIAPSLNNDSEIKLIDLLEEEACKNSIAIKGAKQFTAQLTGKWAIVTSASNGLANTRLITCSIDLPEVLITSDDVNNGKPDPEPYLLAAKLLNVAPKDCIVFEDALPGILSALNAGCKVIQVGGLQAIHPSIEFIIQDFTTISLQQKKENYILTKI
jgi:mannitol-1-/sugar-/sorbitol-6-phosphatase